MPTGVNSMALFRNLITRHRCRHREENDESVEASWRKALKSSKPQGETSWKNIKKECYLIIKLNRPFRGGRLFTYGILLEQNINNLPPVLDYFYIVGVRFLSFGVSELIFCPRRERRLHCIDNNGGAHRHAAVMPSSSTSRRHCKLQKHIVLWRHRGNANPDAIDRRFDW